MKSRGIIKWLPFSALEEQSPYLQKVKRDKQKVERPRISNDRAAQINNMLLNIPKGKILITYFEDGFILQIYESIKKINFDKQKIYTTNKIISFKNLLNLERY